MENKDLVSISSHLFISQKNKILVAKCMVMESENLTNELRQELVENVLSSHNFEDTVSTTQKSQGVVSFLTSFFRSDKPKKAKDFLAARNMELSDAQFLSSLNEILGQEPLLQEAITNVVALAEGHFQKKIDSTVKKLVGRAVMAQEAACKAQIDRDAESQQDARQKESRRQFISDIDAQNQGDS